MTRGQRSDCRWSDKLITTRRYEFYLRMLMMSLLVLSFSLEETCPQVNIQSFHFYRHKNEATSGEVVCPTK